MVTVFAYLVNRTSGGAGIPRGQTHRFFLNGHELGSSAGDASLIEQQTQGFWIRKVYTVPIEWLHFPRRGDPEGRFASERAPVGGDNPVRVTIAPVAGEEVWCTVVKPWTVRVTGMSPVVMIHCNDCLATLWEQVGFKTYLDSINVPNDNSIQLPHTLDNFPKPNCNGFADVRIASFRGNAAIIENRLSRILESFGANSVHLVAHSKGGLDSREWLATYSRRHNNKNGFNVLSLTTADTPHRGSAHADAQMAWEQVGWTGLLDEFLNGPPDPGGLMADLGHSLTGVNCGKPFLTTQNVNGAFNPANVPLLPADVVYQAISADADNDGDGHMFLAHAGLVGIPFDNVADIPEWGGLTYADSSLKSVAEYDPPVAAKVADTMYHFLKDVGSVSVQATVGFKFVFPFGFVPVYGTSIVEEGTGGRNDTAVTIESASGPPGGAFKHILSFVGANGRDHVAVIDDGVAAAVVPYLLLVEQQRQR